MTRPELIEINRTDLRVGDRLWGEPNLVALDALIVGEINRGLGSWRVVGHGDGGEPRGMFIADHQVLIEPRH